MGASQGSRLELGSMTVAHCYCSPFSHEGISVQILVLSVLTLLLYIPDRWTCFGAMLAIEQRLLQSAPTFMTERIPIMYLSVSTGVW